MTETIYMVDIAFHDEVGGAFYRTREAAEQAQEWFDEHSPARVYIREVPLNDEFAPPEEFYRTYLRWGYESG